MVSLRHVVDQDVRLLTGAPARTRAFAHLAVVARRPLLVMEVQATISIVETPELLISHDFRVAQDAAQFYLVTGQEGSEQMMEILHEATTNGIAQRGGFAMVISPVQNNFHMPFRVEAWSAEPFSDIDGWQEAFELHLDVSDYGLQYSSPVAEEITFEVPPGSYRALITARGFLAAGWPGSTEPGDVWRIRLWPDDAPVVARKIREFVEPTPIGPADKFDTAGREAVRRLQRMLDDRVPLSGERGTAIAERTLPGTRRKLYPPFHNPRGWLTQGSMEDDESYILGGGRGGDNNPFADANRIVPSSGRIRGIFVDAKTPEYAEAIWSWEVPASYEQGDNRAVISSWASLIPPPDMTLRFELTNGPATEDWPTTVVKVIHNQVPVEFIDDLTAYWLWKLEDADLLIDLSKERRKKSAQKSSTRIRNEPLTR